MPQNNPSPTRKQGKWFTYITGSLFLIPLCGQFLPAQEASKPLRQVIDGEIKTAWQKEKITPAGRSIDTTFLRRVYLDLVGMTPTYEETTVFLKDTDGRKREKLIDKLLADPRFAAAQAQVWDLVLFGRNPSGYED